MDDINQLMEAVSGRLESLARSNAVVGRTISVGERHVLPLCELALAFGGGGGTGEALDGGAGNGSGKGTGSGAGGMAKAIPVAVVIVDGADVRVERLAG